jgi:serine protease
MKSQLKFMLDKYPDILKNEAPYIVVRFRPELKFNYEELPEKQLLKYNFSGWEDLRKKFDGARMVPHFTAAKPDRLREMLKKAVETDQTYKPAPLFSYFRIEHKDPFQLLEMEKTVREWKNVVEYSSLYVPAPDPVVSPADDPRVANQGYLNAAPQGIDARYAWTFTGGDGALLQLVDMERGWTFDHEDLNAHGVTLLHGVLLDSSRGHGTSVLGQICAVDNALGCVGITPHLARVMTTSFNGSTQANAIIAGIAALSFGDVLLLEAQNWVPEISMMLGPIELTDDTYEAIRLATALGIVVVEAGGNGTNNGSAPAFDLDLYVNAAGNAIFNPAAATFRDSGAIIVTAATSAAPHTRLVYGPHGARIDCYAWGQNIDTLNSDSTGATNQYRTNFGGTSGASPIITGAGLAVQGIAQDRLGFRFSPRQLRALLRNPATGTAADPTETTLINVMPDLRLILDNILNVAPDVYLRDFVGDVGDPHSGAISVSPDVIVTATAPANPQTAYGEGSGTENNATLGGTVQGGVNHFVFVRARNRGGAAAAGVTAAVYWSEVASLVTPDLWNLIGTTAAFNVPNGDQLTVSNALSWPAAAIPGDGHYCFVALLGHPLDPAPSATDFLNWTNFTNFIRNNNNVTWRNFNVLPAEPSPDADPSGYAAMPFLMVGAPDKARPFNFSFEAKLPVGARLLFEMPIDFYKATRQYFSEAYFVKNEDLVRAFVNPFGRTFLKNVRLSAKYRGKCRFLVSIPDDLHKNRYSIRLRQYSKDLQVGGITWLVGGKF